MNIIERTFPEKYPDLASFIAVAHELRGGKSYKSLSEAPEELISQVMDIMTPDEILHAAISEPETFTSLSHPTFDSLLVVRDRIRRLELAPKKNDEYYFTYYSKLDKEQLKRITYGYVANDPFALELNLFPDDLPPDLEAYTLWIKNKDTPRREIANYISDVMTGLNIGINEVILFEKPITSKTKFIEPSMQNLRHIHMFVKVNDPSLAVRPVAV